jgi:hypothetical protein
MIRDDPKLNFKDSGYNRAMPISNINDDCYNAAILFSVVLQLELVYLRFDEDVYKPVLVRQSFFVVQS